MPLQRSSVILLLKNNNAYLEDLTVANIFVLEIASIKPYNVGLAGNQAFHESPN